RLLRRLLRLGVARRQKPRLFLLDVDAILVDDALRVALAGLAAVIEPDRLVAESLDEAERVRDEENRLAAAFEVRELVVALVREALVADREHLVHEEHVGIDM